MSACNVISFTVGCTLSRHGLKKQTKMATVKLLNCVFLKKKGVHKHVQSEEKFPLKAAKISPIISAFCSKPLSVIETFGQQGFRKSDDTWINDSNTNSLSIRVFSRFNSLFISNLYFYFVCQ